MSLQRTVDKEITLRGIEPYGGNTVEVTIRGAPENSGYVFRAQNRRTKEWKSVRASLDTAKPSKFINSFLLDGKELTVLHSEHVISALYAYGIDNAEIDIRRIPNETGRYWSTDTEALPNFEEREYTLCKLLDDNVVEQREQRRLLTVRDEFTDGKLTVRPGSGPGLMMRAKTSYKLPSKEVVEEFYSVEISPERYRDELSLARPLMSFQKLYRHCEWFLKILGSVLYPHFGIGHGITEKHFCLPVRNKKEWDDSRLFYGELARHTIVDRLAAFALLDGRLDEVDIDAYRSNHANDLRFLNENRAKFVDIN